MRMSMKHLALLLAGIALTATACLKSTNTSNSVQEQYNTDTKLIQDYLTNHAITAQQDSSGIFYKIDSMGTGINPKLGDTIQVKYIGKLLTDSIFQKVDTAITFILSQGLIPAWQICIPKINAGGGIDIYSQSYFGFGGVAQQGIPANSVLIFNVQLLNVRPVKH